MKLDAQLKRATLINKMLKKQRVELHKIGRAQDMRKKNLEKLSKGDTAVEQQPLFIPSIPLEAATPQPPHREAQSSIAIPLIHSMEGGASSLEYGVGSMMHEGMEGINIFSVFNKHDGTPRSR